MSRFVGCQRELDSSTQVRAQGGTQFPLVSGQRRVGWERPSLPAPSPSGAYCPHSRHTLV